MSIIYSLRIGVQGRKQVSEKLSPLLECMKNNLPHASVLVYLHFTYFLKSITALFVVIVRYLTSALVHNKYKRSGPVSVKEDRMLF